MQLSSLAALASCLGLLGCMASPEPGPYAWSLPADVSPPPVPADNAMGRDKVELGRRLFFDRRLSSSGTVSCATCHEPEHAFTVPEAVHEGETGEATPRNAPSLLYVGYASYLTWGNLTLRTLEQQMLAPLFGDNPVEMGAGMGMRTIVDRLTRDETLQAGFAAAFAGLAPEDVGWPEIIDAIAAYQRGLAPFQSPWDAHLAGDASALTPAARRGATLFASERLGCAQCHAGRLLSLAFPTDGTVASPQRAFASTGLYHEPGGPAVYLDGSSSGYPHPNQGLAEFTQDPDDDGKHRIPSLRNVARTAPYMHDGSVSTLREVLELYSRGGRTDHPGRDPRLRTFALDEREVQDLLSFFASLSDRT